MSGARFLDGQGEALPVESDDRVCPVRFWNTSASRQAAPAEIRAEAVIKELSHGIDDSAQRRYPSIRYALVIKHRITTKQGAKDIYDPGAPHCLTATHQDRINAHLPAFIKWVN